VPARKSSPAQKSSVVYFSPAGGGEKRDPYRAIDALFRKVVSEKTITKGDYVAIKLHFGEAGNVRYIRPTFARRLADLVRKAGGFPYATDTLTLYRHQRHNLFAHLDTAADHGFTRETLGCPVLIADGLRSSGVEVQVPDAKEILTCTVAQAVYDADVLINLAHLTLHPEFPLGAALKNLGMGCVTRQTKLRLHGKTVNPVFDASKCVLCGRCLRLCPGNAFALKRRKIRFDKKLCVSCGDCFSWCEGGALGIPWGEESQIVQRRTCEAARGVLSTFSPEKVTHFVIAMDVTPGCDCFGASDLPIVPDIGIFASTDLVAVDMAALDAIQAAPAYPGSQVDGTKGGMPGGDKIAEVWPALDVEVYRGILAGSGLGSLRYQLRQV